MPRPTGLCRLCRKTGPLCESHIIPEALYGPSYDCTHRLTKWPPSPGGKPTYLQKGLKEYLLCESCENLLNTSYEQPFKKYWYDGRALPDAVPVPDPGRDDVVLITGFDYATFKLFHLSVLWRASVASIQGFRSVNLGPYEDKLRKMLLNKDPGPATRYPIWGRVLLFGDGDRRVIRGLVGTPLMRKVRGNHVYIVYYAGCEWWFTVTDHPTREFKENDPNLLQRNGTILLRVVDGFQSIACQSWRQGRKK